MNNKERRIVAILSDKLNIPSVSNPMDVKGLVIYHNATVKILNDIRHTLLELSCYDIPKERVDEILEELEESNEK